MSFDTFLGLFGAVTGVVGLFFAYFFYKKSVRTKLLSIAYTDSIPLMVTFGEVKANYGGVATNALSRIYILLWNRGTAPIEASDFLSPIAFRASAPILTFGIHDKDAASDVTVNYEAHEVAINLLRPGEAITLIAETTSEAWGPDIRVEMKSADMSTFIAALHTTYPWVAGFLVAGLTLAIQLLILFIFREALFAGSEPAPFGPYKEDPGAMVLGMTAIGMLLALIAAFLAPPIIFGILARRVTRALMGRTVTPVAWRFSEFKLSAYLMQNQFKQFKKSMDTEFKKIAPS